MKTMNFKVALMMAAVIGSTAFVSCSSDDEDGTKGGGMTSKRIVKVYYDGSSDATIDYDSQGRVVKVNGVDNVTTYTYGENFIISKNQSEWGEETITYTLSNGLITKSVYKDDANSYTITYTYDSNGYMTSQITTVGGITSKMTLTWADGNLTKLSEVHDNSYSSYLETVTISYSDILWPQNFMMTMDGTGLEMDEALEPLGVWGKMPKNLPNKTVSIYDGGETFEKPIDYTVENGEVTNIIFYRSDGNTEIITYEWK